MHTSRRERCTRCHQGDRHAPYAYCLNVTRRVTHAEDYRRRPGVPGWRHASARRADRGSDQGLHVRRLGDALFRSRVWRRADRVFTETFDLLLGRKTYEIFAAYWPYDDAASHGGIAKLFNDSKKYAVSRSGEVDTSWAGSVLLRDIADVKRLKQEDGPHLVTQGSTALVRAARP